jgi:Flp pilus assembly protein TadD
MGSQSMKRRFQRLQRLAAGSCVAVTIIYARKFLARYPDHGPAWTLLGVALVETARYAEAEFSLATALDLCPASKRHIVLGQLGHLSREAGNYDQAAAWYRKAIAAAPRDAGNYVFLGAMLAKQGRLGEAEAAHREATQCVEGEVSEAFLNLGFVLRAQDRLAEAADSFREAIRLDPGYRDARMALRDVKRALLAGQGNC